MNRVCELNGKVVSTLIFRLVELYGHNGGENLWDYRITLEFLGRLGRGVRKGTSRSQNGDSFVKEGERNN